MRRCLSVNQRSHDGIHRASAADRTPFRLSSNSDHAPPDYSHPEPRIFNPHAAFARSPTCCIARERPHHRDGIFNRGSLPDERLLEWVPDENFILHTNRVVHGSDRFHFDGTCSVSWPRRSESIRREAHPLPSSAQVIRHGRRYGPAYPRSRQKIVRHHRSQARADRIVGRQHLSRDGRRLRQRSQGSGTQAVDG